MQIAKVISRDGVPLYTRVQAKPGLQFKLSQDLLQQVANDRTAAELRDDDYWPAEFLPAWHPDSPGPEQRLNGDHSAFSADVPPLGLSPA